MQFTFNKVTHFSRLVKAGNRLREFNFKKISGMPEGEAYHIDVADEQGERLIFKLWQTEGNWVPSTTMLPVWVTEAVPQLQHILSNYSGE